MMRITVPAEKILPGVTSCYEFGIDDEGCFVKISLRNNGEIVFRFNSESDVMSFLNRLALVRHQIPRERTL